jgi:hypothetical protein
MDGAERSVHLTSLCHRPVKPCIDNASHVEAALIDLQYTQWQSFAIPTSCINSTALEVTPLVLAKVIRSTAKSLGLFAEYAMASCVRQRRWPQHKQKNWHLLNVKQKKFQATSASMIV